MDNELAAAYKKYSPPFYHGKPEHFQSGWKAHEEYAKTIPQIPVEPQWIDMKNDTPNPNQLVWVCSKFGNVTRGYYIKKYNDWTTDFYDKEDQDNITHWMPFYQPKPFKTIK
jgi:hypothetical protein